MSNPMTFNHLAEKIAPDTSSNGNNTVIQILPKRDKIITAKKFATISIPNIIKFIDIVRKLFVDYPKYSIKYQYDLYLFYPMWSIR